MHISLSNSTTKTQKRNNNGSVDLGIDTEFEIPVFGPLFQNRYSEVKTGISKLEFLLNKVAKIGEK